MDIYTICAIVGGVVFLCQFAASLIGLGHDSDHDLGHESDQGSEHGGAHEFLAGILSLRSISAAITFFGLAGRVAKENEFGGLMIALIALGAGAAALFIVAILVHALYKLEDDGTIRIERAVGQTGTVYLTIPAQKAGVGKVTVKTQNRLMEYRAVTAHGELATGVNIVVVDIIGPDTVEVAPAVEDLANKPKG